MLSLDAKLPLYDAVVVGLGGMGSAALAHIAQRGKRVLGIEAFARGHELGASAGRSRIIRKAYFEDPAYVPLLLRAYELWHELERTSGERVLDLTGLLMAGAESSPVLRGALASARLHDIALEELDAKELSRRYPSLLVRAGEAGLLEPGAGVLFPEKAIAAHLRVAQAAGAQTSFLTRVVAYRCESDAVVLELSNGAVVHTERLAVCAGPWLRTFAAELGLPIRIQRNVQAWFRPAVARYAAGRFPAFFVDRSDAPAPLYGFPDYGDGVKAALHAYGEDTSPDDLERAIRPDDVAPIRRALDAWMPGAAAEFAFGKACMYALTPDEHFVIDVHPADARIVIAGGFSGHGFKFASVVGEIVADLALNGATVAPIDFLRAGRFAHPGARQGVR